MIDYHQFFFFLGTLQGNLLRSFIELVLFTLITYMIISEYTREKKRELKYLTLAFALLAIQRLVITIFFGSIVFGDIDFGKAFAVLPIIDNVLELIALIMLANAFLYPLFIKKHRLRTFIKAKVIIVIFFGIIVQILWFFRYINVQNWDVFFGNILFIMMKISILLYPIVVLDRFKKIRIRYKNSVLIAFYLYLAAPLLRLINVLFYHGVDDRISIVENIFPVLSVLMFTRIIYLKLVDKAYLKSRLEESERLYEEEKKLGKLKDEFISTVSHELRTPLTSIKLYSSLMESGKMGRISEKQKEGLNVIKEETNRLTHLIDDILNLSKLEAKQVKVNKAWFNVHEVVGNSVYYHDADKENISVEVKVPQKMRIYADKAKFIQIFVNLMGNAIKYNKPGGSITVIGKDKKKESIIKVKDSGIGITKEELPRLFDKFYRIEDYMTTSRQGAGLGLAIVKKLVELHDGKIEVESKVGRGSVFTVIMPKE